MQLLRQYKEGEQHLTTAVEGKIQGKRARGRHRNNWLEDVNEWTQMTAYECTSKADARHLWSVIARRPSKTR